MSIINTFKYSCNTCAHLGSFNDGSPGCGKYKIKVDPQKDFCSQHKNTDTITCHFCSNSENLTIHYFGDDNMIVLCPDHTDAIGKCGTCELSRECAFNRDNSGEPKYVMRQVRQGNVFIQQQIQNPKLVDKYCVNCPCYLTDISNGICLKRTPDAECPSWRLQKELIQ